MVKRIASICLAASLLASMAAPFSLAARPLTDSLGDPVLDLSFEGTLADGSTLQHPVTASEESKLTFVDGVEEGTQAVELQGAHLNLGTSVELQPQDLTLSFWLKPTQTMTGEQIITWNKNEYNADGWYLSSLNDSIPLELSIGPGSSQPYLVAVDGNRSEFFPAGEWTHIVVTYDHVTKDVNIYRNGIPQTTRIKYGINDSSTGILGQTDAMKSIGWNGEVYKTDSSHLRGALDEYRVYDEVATQKDVLALYEEMGGQVDGAEVAQADLNGLTIPSRTTENLTLPAEGASGSTIRWESSDPDVIALDGTVVRGEEDQTVTLTAYAQYQDAPEQSREFTVVVAAQVREGLNIENSGLENVTLTDDYLVNASQQELNYLADTLDPNRFLYECYKSAGLNPADYGSTQGYPEGWERSQGSNFRSHAFGHYMSAMAMMYRSYNYSTDNAQVKTLRDKLETAVEGLKVCQQATYTDDNPDNDGFVAAFPVEVLGLADGLSTSNEPVVVPYYNLHKVLAGLLEIYNDLSLSPKAEDQTLAQDALTLAENLGIFLYNRLVGHVSKDRMLATEYGGMNDALYELYRLSGDPKHKEVAQLFDETSLFWELANGNDVLNGKHANTTIPKFIGALKRYTVLSEPEYYDQLTQEEKDELPQYLKAAESFWDTVVNHHTYVTGGNSCSEHFHAADQLYAQATGSNGGAETTCETCNTYNMLKLSRELFKVTGKKKYLDYYENTYINAILPSQNPETGMTMYFQPMAPGHNKVYSRPDTEFWCCTGTGMESFSKLGDSLYYTDENQVYVSMFFSSTFTDQERNLKLTQTANMPNEDTVTFQVESLDGGQVKEGTQLLVRVPDWLAGPLTVEKNGVAYEYDTSYGFAVIDVAAGDEIVCTMPMEVVAYDLPDNANFVAFKYGPMVLSADLGDKDIDSYVPNGILVRAATLDADAQTVIGIQNQSVEQWLDNLAENLVRVEDDEKGRVQFVLKNTDSDDGALVYTPHYMQHGVRYGLYMYLEEPDSPAMQERILAEKQSLREEERAVSNLTNFDANNSEAAKDLKFDRSSVGVFQGRQYRHAESGGWFSYNMELDVTAEHNYLRCTYYGGDVGRSFDVYLNGEKFKTERITDENGKVFYYVVDEIPQEYLDNPNYKLNEDGSYKLDENGEKIPVIEVKFQSTGGYAGGLFGISILNSLEYDKDPALSGLSFEEGTLTPELTQGVTDYTLTVPTGTQSVTMDVDPHTPSGLIYVGGEGGILIDDTLSRTVALTGEETVFTLRSYAQDHETYLDYTITVKTQDQEPTQVDKTILQTTYDYARTLSTDGVAQSAADYFRQVLEEAGQVLADPNATQEQVNSAWDNLLEGIWGLGLIQGDKTMLDLVILRAQDMVAQADKYVATHWPELVDALAAAETVQKDGDALQGDVDQATDALLDAILAQRFQADKSILEELLTKAQGMDLTGYTAESVAAFRSALASAQAVLADESLTEDDQAVVTQAVDTLTAAMEGLTAEGAPETTDEPEATQTPEATQQPQATQKPERVPQTGDAAQLWLWLASGGAAAGTALMGAAVHNRKRKK